MFDSILRSSVGSDCSSETLKGNEAVGLEKPGYTLIPQDLR